MPRKQITPATGYYQGFEIQGLDEIERKLQGLEEAVRRKYIRKALEEGAEHVRAEAARTVKKAEGGPTHPKHGHLANNGVVAKVWVKAQRSNATVGVNWQTHSYGHLIEFGHKLPNGKETIKQPFMRTAYENKKQQALDEILTQLRDAVLKEVANGS